MIFHLALQVGHSKARTDLRVLADDIARPL